MFEDAVYRNFQHYLVSQNALEPKRIFKFTADILQAKNLGPECSILDLGCAAGEFLAYVNSRFNGIELHGIDLQPELLTVARLSVPKAQFHVGSVLSIPPELHGRFDIVTGIGVMGVFDDVELKAYLKNVAACLKPAGGRMLLVEPYNEYGFDLVVAHRKRAESIAGPWERGNSIYSMETVMEILENSASEFIFHPFDIGMELRPQVDKQRTWTISTASKNYQLINGAKLMMDIYALEVFAVDRSSVDIMQCASNLAKK